MPHNVCLVRADGYITVPEVPGLGVDIDVDECAKYPSTGNINQPDAGHGAPILLVRPYKWLAVPSEASSPPAVRVFAFACCSTDFLYVYHRDGRARWLDPLASNVGRTNDASLDRPWLGTTAKM